MKSKTQNLLESIQTNLKESSLPKPTNKTEFKGFDITKVSNTDNSYKLYQDILDNPDVAKNKGFTAAYIAEITPQDYMNLCSLYIASSTETNLELLSDLEGIQKHFAERAIEIAEAMKKGEKVPLPLLDIKFKEQDGRHRAVAAYIDGIKTIPCLICY